MNTNIVIAASLLFGLVCIGCAPAAHTQRASAQGNLRSSAGANEMSVVGTAMRQDIPPCQAACEHILILRGEENHHEAESWVQTCGEACEAHGSQGQLACYARAKRAEDLKACETE